MAETIQYQSTLPDLIKTIMGSSTETKGTANVDPLMQVFQAAMQAQGAGVPEMQALIASIFQEGSKQVPGLIQAYANSTGTRANNNSALTLALGDLNRTMSTQAAEAILKNQTQNRQIATDAAGGVASATKSSKAVTGTKTNPLIPLVGGFALNQFGKSKTGKKILDGDFLGGGDETASNIARITESPISDVVQMNNPSAYIGSFGDGAVGSAFDFGDWGPSAAEYAADILPTESIFEDFASDFASDIGGSIVEDVGGSIFEDLFDWFGADGGAVKRAGRGYADGGTVMPESVAPDVGGAIIGTPDYRRKKRPNLGTDNPFTNGGDGNLGLGAISAPINQAISYEETSNVSNPEEPIFRDEDEVLPDWGPDAPPGMYPNIPWNPIITPIIAGVTGIPSPIVSILVRAIAERTGSVTAGPLNFLNQNNANTPYYPDAPTEKDIVVEPGPLTTDEVKPDAEGSPEGNMVTDTGNDADYYDTPSVNFDDRIVSGGAGVTSGMGGNYIGSGSGAGGWGWGNTGSVSAGPLVTSSGGGGGGGGGAGGGTSWTSGSMLELGIADGGSVSDAVVNQMSRKKAKGYNDGGAVKGPGTEVSDSIPANLSDGEYVIPADVVRVIGTRSLDRLIAAVHKPAQVRK